MIARLINSTNLASSKAGPIQADSRCNYTCGIQCYSPRTAFINIVEKRCQFGVYSVFSLDSHNLLDIQRLETVKTETPPICAV
ncbi:hypothetical protein A0J61_01624 [Choanephora cucurbitarum]|uniref:Uncharacterized protein n=1 Tax=Choanephora cucurbitarum TaxID=101091 RepID=A0A1C7NML6_9FUNG|nr:hypothetical protein A0J61_01624 [Choanephora cucurbitarum]